MKIAIVINADRITKELQDLLESNALKEKYNMDYDLYLSKPDKLESIFKNLNYHSYNGIVVGGGDGTIRTAAQFLIEQPIPLAILPLGTFNVLARSLEHTNDIEKILAMIKNNKTKQIDLGQVNEHIIINHAWIGFYYYILKFREKHKQVLGRNKLLKILFNTWSLFKVFPIYRLTLKIDGITQTRKTCLVYIGNNDSYTNVLDFGERKSLTSGLLAVTILNCHNRWELFLCMLSILLGKFAKSQFVSQLATDDLTIDTQLNYINMVIDGELFKLTTPLHFSMNKKKLTVFIF